MNSRAILAALVMAAVLAGGCKNQEPPKSEATTQSSQPAPGPIDRVIDKPDRSHNGPAAITPVKAGGKALEAAQADSAQLAKDNDDLRRDLDTKSKELAELRKAFSQADSDARDTMAGMEDRIALLSKNNASLQKALDKIVQSDDTKTDAGKELARQLDEANKAIDGMSAELARQRDFRKKDRTDLAAAQDEVDRLRLLLKDINTDAKGAIAQLLADNRALRRTQDELAKALAALQDEKQVLKRDNVAMAKTIDRLRDDNAALQSQLDKPHGDGPDKDDLAAANRKIAQLTKDKAELSAQIKSAQAKNDQQAESIRAMSAEIARENKLLKELQAKLEDAGSGDTDVRRRLAEKDRKITDLEAKVAQQEKEIQDLNKRLGDRPRPTATPTPTNPPTPTTQPRSTAPATVRPGVVTAVRGDTVTLSMPGAKVGMALVVQRDGKAIGRLTVKSVDGGQTVAQVTEGRGLRAGDRAVVLDED